MTRKKSALATAAAANRWLLAAAAAASAQSEPRVAPEGVGVYAPAFDVTPNELITAIVTEKEILRQPYAAAIARTLELS